VLHPINKLLAPHYRDTMNINADGIIENIFAFKVCCGNVFGGVQELGFP
jgi:hypothetical protein